MKLLRHAGTNYSDDFPIARPFMLKYVQCHGCVHDVCGLLG